MSTPRYIANRAPKRTRVLCLGPKKTKHYFLTSNPASNRVCSDCRAIQDAARVSPLCHEVFVIEGRTKAEY